MMPWNEIFWCACFVVKHGQFQAESTFRKWINQTKTFSCHIFDMNLVCASNWVVITFYSHSSLSFEIPDALSIINWTNVTSSPFEQEVSNKITVIPKATENSSNDNGNGNNKNAIANVNRSRKMSNRACVCARSRMIMIIRCSLSAGSAYAVWSASAVFQF